MDSELATLRFKEEIEKLQNGIVAEYVRPSDIFQEGNSIFFNLPIVGTTKKFLLKVDCDEDFPKNPADYMFVNPTTKLDDDKKYWPDDNQQAFKNNENPRWICLAGTKEYKNRHSDKYNPKTNSLSQTVFHILRQMNGWKKT